MAIKTLHLTNAWHSTSGGVAIFYRALMQEANRRGQKFRLVVPAEQDRVEEIGEHARIYHVAAPAAILNSSYRTIYPTQFLFKESALQAILAEERPDVVEISDKYTLAYLGGLLRLRLLGSIDFRPVVIGLSSERMDDNFRSYLKWVPLGKKFCSWYMHWVYFPFFDHHIANSHYTAEELRVASAGHMVSRGTWVRHMGVELDEFSPSHRSEQGRKRVLAVSGAPEDATLLLYIGRIAPEKNIRLLFELTERLNRLSIGKYHLLIAGDGMDRARWERYAAAQMPGRVGFLGHIRERKMLATLYANADVFVHPNPHEPFGIAPLEAMASGLPLVAPDSGGVTSYANLENAWTAPPTAKDFAAAVAEILSTPKLVAEKTQNALAAVANYRWEKVAASFLDLYQDLHRDFHGQAANFRADFYSTPAKPGTALLAHWTSQLAQKMFSGIAHARESQRQKTKPGNHVAESAQTEEMGKPENRRLDALQKL
jgi:alpha-1,6-mannosyltransferase